MNEPIIGWRIWNNNAFSLRSLNNRQIWPWNKPLQSDELPPLNPKNLGSQHGIHAWKTFDDACNMISYEIWNGYHVIIGQVYLWGKIVEHEDGYRSEFAYPKSLMFWNFKYRDDMESNFKNNYGCEIISDFTTLNKLANTSIKMLKIYDGQIVRSFSEFREVQGDLDFKNMPTINHVRI